MIFAILWLPVHIHLLVAYFGTLPQNEFYHSISVLWNCLAYFNSCANPIIYNFASHEFRDGFKAALRCARRQHDPRYAIRTSMMARRSSAYPTTFGKNTFATSTNGSGAIQLPEVHKILVSPETDITSDDRAWSLHEGESLANTTRSAV